MRLDLPNTDLNFEFGTGDVSSKNIWTFPVTFSKNVIKKTYKTQSIPNFLIMVKVELLNHFIHSYNNPPYLQLLAKITQKSIDARET